MKHLRYLSYVLRHKWHVFVACRGMGVPLWQSVIHDASKFSRAEWGPYVNWFYGRELVTEPEYTNQKAAFEKAWEHHWRNNPHHWDRYVGTSHEGGLVPFVMPDCYVREMVADWIGAGRAMGKPDIIGWYIQNRARMVLCRETRELAERYLETYFMYPLTAKLMEPT